MITGQMLWLPKTGARFQVIETSPDGTQGVAAGERTGGRLLVIDDGCFWVRSVEDNGQNSATLLGSLTPVGPRYAARAVTA